MPIPVNELKKAARPLKDRILEFLKADPAHAYAIDEILVGVEGVESDAAMWLITAPEACQRLIKRYVEALQALVTERKLAIGRVQDRQYFSIRKR